MHACLSRRKPRPNWDARAARGGGRGKDRVHQQSRKGQRQASRTHHIALPPFARWALPSSCLSAGERRREDTEGYARGSGDPRIALPPLPLPAVPKALEEVSGLCPCPLPRQPSWLLTGGVETLGGASPPSLTSFPASTIATRATASRASPCGPLPQGAQTKGSLGCHGRAGGRTRWPRGPGCCGGRSQGWSG